VNSSHSSTFCQPLPAPGSALDDARQEIRARLGFAPERLYETNGRPIRFGRGKSAWAFVHYVNGTWFVHYGDWRDYPVRYTWFSRSQHGLTEVERRRLDEDIRRLLEQEKLEREGQRAAAARSVQEQWEALPPAPPSHPYLVRKGVQPHGLRVRAGSLVVPLYDGEGQLWSWQTITPGGEKRFYKGGRAFGLFHPFGTHEDFERGKAILVCEGWATGATLHEATGLPVVAAMNAGNLLPVARALREKFPGQRLVICADDDWQTPGNPGTSKAKEAACFVGAVVAIPVWTDTRDKRDTDFNDLARVEGLDTVRRLIGAVLVAPESRTDSATDSAPAPDETTEGKAKDRAKAKAPVKEKDKALVKAKAPVKAKVKAEAAVEPAGQDAVSILSRSVRPGLDERPCFWLVEEQTVIGGRCYKAGVYHCGSKHEKQCGELVPVPTETWLASPIRLKARTVQWPDGAQGVRLDVHDGSVWHDVVLPRETLASSRDYRKILLAKGAILETHSKDARAWLEEYLQQSLPRWEYTTERTGWHDKQYVLPDTTIGKGVTILFTGKRATDEPLTAGELADWQQAVAALAVGNPLLVFSISLAFAGPLLRWVGHNAVLVQLVGRSTTGKTTCLLAANSVVGPPALVATWRTTADGLEQKALTHCDGFLALDEIGQVDAKTLDHMVYTLGNGTAKQRAQVYDHGVGAAPSRRWRVAALSTGEKTLETLLAMDRRNVNAGQAVRFVEIPAEERYGAFTELRGYGSGAVFADTLRRATSRYYGTPIRAFLEKLCNDDRDALNRDTLNQALDKCTGCLLEAVKNSGAAPGAQASRVLTSMALVAVAGELATAYGITGWSEGEAFRAALHCYRLWAQRRAAGTDFETVSVIRLVYDFITRHGDSRFSPIGGGIPAGNDIPDDEQAGDDIPGGESGTVSGTVYVNNPVVRPVVHHRAGYYRDLRNGDRQYLFTADGFDEAVHGFDPRRARQELKHQGVLIQGKGHDSQLVRPGPGQPRVRVYVISFNALNRALELLGGCE